MTTFAEWQATRVWCHDFVAAGLDHVGDLYDESRGVISGYAYDVGWIEELPGGQYWVIVFNEDRIGTLEQCERFLWEKFVTTETDYTRRERNASGCQEEV